MSKQPPETPDRRIRGIAPFWHDHCEHGEDERICSFFHEDARTRKTGKYDLYVFHDNITGAAHVCIRYGPGGGDYLSPGALPYFIRAAALPDNGLYWRALEYMLKEGEVTYFKRRLG